MPLITYLPEKKALESLEGETLLQAAQRNNIPHATICGGTGRCSTCRVSVLEGLEHCSPRTAQEQTIADMLHFLPNVRLACQTIPSGDVKVRRLVEDLEDVDLTTLFVEGVEVCAIGEEKSVLILFSDIQGFTAFAESLLPYDVIYSLNLHLRQMGEIINNYGGRIDNYMGDGFMALFEADNPENAALQAVQAGLDMLANVDQHAPYLEELYHRSFRIRIGLHYGKVVAGKLGHPGQKRMTVIGDAVNLASRIETANKTAGTQFLVSEDVFNLVKAKVQVGKSTNMSLRGKSGKYRLYEVIGMNSATQSAGE
jgi:adenylate cyclase